jgi:hypothetical protein
MAGRALELGPKEIMTLATWRLFHCPVNQPAFQSTHTRHTHSLQGDRPHKITFLTSNISSTFPQYTVAPNSGQLLIWSKIPRSIDPEGSCGIFKTTRRKTHYDESFLLLSPSFILFHSYLYLVPSFLCCNSE